MSTDQPVPTDAHGAAEPSTDAAQDAASAGTERPLYGILGMTLRELLIVGAWLIAFVTSFFPLLIGGSGALWTQALEWIMPIGLPTAAVFLLVLRRFSPQGIRRVGSLAIDQFASVVFSFALLSWVQMLWITVGTDIRVGIVTPMWVPWVQAAMMLALVALTVGAPLIPGLKEDFLARPAAPAHRNANPVRPVVARPRAPRPPQPAAQPAAQPFVQPGAMPYAAPATGAPATGTPLFDASVADSGAQVPLTAHVAGGALGTADLGQGEPVYARRARRFAADAPAAADARGGADAQGSADAAESMDASETRDAAAPASPVEPHPEQTTGDLIEVLGAAAIVGDDEPIDETAAADAPAAETPVEESAAAEASVVAEASVDAAATAAAPIEPTPSAPVAQPFWALAPTERDVLDAQGHPMFRIGPTAWALVIEDRGGAYVVRHDDGRIGYLHDIADITKG